MMTREPRDINHVETQQLKYKNPNQPKIVSVGKTSNIKTNSI